MEEKKGRLRTDIELMKGIAWARKEALAFYRREVPSAEALEAIKNEYLEIATHGEALEDEYKKRFILPGMKNPTKQEVNERFLTDLDFWEMWRENSARDGEAAQKNLTENELREIEENSI